MDESESINQQWNIKVHGEGFDQIIKCSHPTVSAVLQRIKSGYEIFVNHMIENVSIQYEIFHNDIN